MARIIITAPEEKTGVTGRIVTPGPVKVETPAGVVFINYNPDMGAVITVKGDKSTTTIKFNNKAV